MATETKYIEAVGRRKTATARVRITPAQKGTYSVNEKKVDEYFPTEQLQGVVQEAIKVVPGATFKVTVKVSGGGLAAAP